MKPKRPSIRADRGPIFRILLQSALVVIRQSLPRCRLEKNWEKNWEKLGTDGTFTNFHCRKMENRPACPRFPSDSYAAETDSFSD